MILSSKRVIGPLVTTKKSPPPPNRPLTRVQKPLRIRTRLTRHNLKLLENQMGEERTMEQCLCQEAALGRALERPLERISNQELYIASESPKIFQQQTSTSGKQFGKRSPL
jgi:hypothetical protein